MNDFKVLVFMNLYQNKTSETVLGSPWKTRHDVSKKYLNKLTFI